MMLSLDTAYRSFGGEVEASSTPTICRLPDSRRHQLSAIARGKPTLPLYLQGDVQHIPSAPALSARDGSAAQAERTSHAGRQAQPTGTGRRTAWPSTTRDFAPHRKQ